jgi:Protein of unknown function (DUF1592)/Protein of unknown function (DUF1588)/Protein of unknown function (DUF1595)/Protein of unknown function (DUF1585)
MRAPRGWMEITYSLAAPLAFAWGALACTAAIDPPPNGSPNADHAGSGAASGEGVVGATGGGDGGGAMTGSGGSSGAATCDAPGFVPQQRLVRLTLGQLRNSVRSLLGATVADQLSKTFEIGDASTRTFPPLASPLEGTFVTEDVWGKVEAIGSAVSQYVRDTYATATGCQVADTTDTCALKFLTSFAEKAFRRPLTSADSDSVTQVYTESKSFGAAAPEALQQAVWAVMSSPQFIYRVELGSAAAVQSATVGLTPYEMATQLAFFLTDAPPDAMLLQAASQGRLASPADIGGQVDRLLGDASVRDNLQQAVFTYFGVGNLDAVIIDQAKVPEFTLGMKSAMYRETQDFLKATLWGGKVDDLLTSRHTVVNPDLAKLYGVPFPTGAAATPDTFVPVDLPESRTGLLTQAGFLSSRARPDKDSVVGRGLFITATVLCATNPAFPDELKAQIDAVVASITDKSEREKSMVRQTTPPCSACHSNFDPYGLVLEHYDLIGRYRDVDEQGRAIDASATLPKDVGGGTVSGVVELARRLTDNGAFGVCMTRNLLKYALADGDVGRDDCAVQKLAATVRAGDRSFSSLLREIAVSDTMTRRSTSGGM